MTSFIRQLPFFNCVASAPAKLILFGEHAVVSPYSKLGVATSISGIRTYSSSTFFDCPVEDYNLRILTSTSQNSYNTEFLIEDFGIGSDFNIDYSVLNEDLEEFIDQIIEESDHSFEGKELQNIGLVVKGCLYSLGCISHALGGMDVLNETNGVQIDISSEIPLGSGLGSSASVAVALSTSNLKLFDLLSEGNTLIQDDIEMIDDWAFALESIYHGNPSGLDNFVCSRGGFVTLQGGEKECISFGDEVKLDFLLVNTNIPRNTSEIVANVQKRWESSKEEVSGIFSNIETCSTDFLQLCDVKKNKNVTQEEFDVHITDIIRRNQQELDRLGVVGHEKFDEMFRICESHGFRGCKITGAGGGGSGFVFLEKKRSLEDVEMLRCELEDIGFGCLEASDVGGEGVRMWAEGVRIEKVK